jgi:adenosylcobinamide-phosphate synthase
VATVDGGFAGRMMMWPWLVLATLALEALVGYPASLHAAIPHPVVWAGRAIDTFENAWNHPRLSFAVRRLLGCIAILILTCAAIASGLLAQKLVSYGVIGAVIVVILGTVGLAQRSLFVHVNNVLESLKAHDLPAARERVAMIVGRETRSLDETGVSAAALESLAESFNDGIVAPAFWLLLAGLSGVFAYKVLNTADSLIGHKEERWRAFGWAAARADDLVNLIPARLAGLLLVVAGGGGLRVMLRDASKHSSPNAGWPEAAMAGTLGIRLGGPATYDGVLHDRPIFGGGPGPSVAELARGLRIYVVACALLWGIVAATACLTTWSVNWPR